MVCRRSIPRVNSLAGEYRTDHVGPHKAYYFDSCQGDSVFTREWDPSY